MSALAALGRAQDPALPSQQGPILRGMEELVRGRASKSPFPEGFHAGNPSFPAGNVSPVAAKGQPVAGRGLRCEESPAPQTPKEQQAEGCSPCVPMCAELGGGGVKRWSLRDPEMKTL